MLPVFWNVPEAKAGIAVIATKPAMSISAGTLAYSCELLRIMESLLIGSGRLVPDAFAAARLAKDSRARVCRVRRRCSRQTKPCHWEGVLRYDVRPPTVSP